MLFQVHIHSGCGRLGNGGGNLAVSEFRLCLALELRLGDLHGNNRGQSLAEVLRRELTLELCKEVVLVGIVSKGTGKAHLEALEVGTTFNRIDVVDVGVNLLGEAGIIAEGDVNRDDFLGIDADRLRNKLGSSGIEIFDELLQALVGVEDVAAENHPSGRLALSVFVLYELFHLLAEVCKSNPDSLVEESQLAKAVCERVVAIDNGLLENSGIGMEGNRGPGIGGLPDDLNLGNRLTLGILLHEDLPLTVDFGYQEV